MTAADEQGDFWRGEFGDEYVRRNRGSQLIAANAAFFAKVLGRTRDVETALELGSSIGLNLMALKSLRPQLKLSAVEINENAAAELKRALPEVDLHVTSLLDFHPTTTWDLVFTKGVLIHLQPARLPRAYELMYRGAARYLLIAEYYDPKPTEIMYRGNSGKLFKRDFAGEMLDTYSDLSLLDYGFVYRRDPNFPQDDLTWFLLEKR